MSSGLNVNNYTNLPAISKNAALKSLNDMQSVSFRAQNQSARDIYQTENSKSKSSKAFWAVFTLAAGAALAAIVYRYGGKTPSAKETPKAAETALSAVNNAADKTEDVANASDKKTLIQILKNKFKALKEEVKGGFDEYSPASGPTQPKPKNSKLILNDKVNEILSAINGEIPSIAKASDDVEEFARLGKKASDSAFSLLNNNREMDSWIKKTINDFATVSSSSLKRTGIGKSNAFIRTGADSWIYTEGYSNTFRKTTAKVKRRITIHADEMTVAVDNVKNTKKNVETAKEVIKYNGTTGEVNHYKNYKLTPHGIEYSKGMTLSAGASTPEKYIEGYKELADGTVKIARGIEAGRTSKVCYEGKTLHTDGEANYSKILNFDPSGKPEFYNENYVEYADRTRKSAKQFRFFDDGCHYYEDFKVKRSADITAKKKVEFDMDKNPVCLMEGYKEKPLSSFSADTRIEYKSGTGEPEYYYENYKYDEATGDITYSLKTKFKKGKWIKVG